MRLVRRRGDARGVVRHCRAGAWTRRARPRRELLARVARGEAERSASRRSGMTISSRSPIRPSRSGRPRMQSPFFARRLPMREQSAEPAPSVAARGIGDDVGRAVGEGEARAHDEAETSPRAACSASCLFRSQLLDACPSQNLLQRGIGAHDAGDGVAVGDADAGMAERERFAARIARMRCAAQEGEIRRGRELGISCHGKSPCRNQRGAALLS